MNDNREVRDYRRGSYYCCSDCGMLFHDGPTWTANTVHSCPARSGLTVVVANPSREKEKR